MLKSPVQIVVVVCAFALAFFALWRGIPLRFAGIDVNPIRSDVVTIKDAAQLISQDASRRAILLVPRSDSGRSLFNACSEPPPDVAQSLVQGLSSSLDAIAKKGAELEASLAAKMTSELKTAAELIFQRSQGIQLLRDTMFRLCEALQNGVIEKDDYRTLIQSLITTANFIIPFEQCTGMARASQAQLATDTLESLVRGCLQAAIAFNELNRAPKIALDRTPTDTVSTQDAPPPASAAPGQDR